MVRRGHLRALYLALNQSAHDNVTERLVHSPGLRAYGVVPGTGLDFDMTGIYQTGRNGAREVQAFGGVFELGHTWKSHPWQPRLSGFYGYASGDRDPTDGQDNRFERFFGFGRPWSANDYIQFENISTPKLRFEAAPTKTFRFDFGYSWYWLASSQDRFYATGKADRSGKSGSFAGHEFDLRFRCQLNKHVEATLGYAHFTNGGQVASTLRGGDSDFAYLEISVTAF